VNAAEFREMLHDAMQAGLIGAGFLAVCCVIGVLLAAVIA
jgi:hypothetical protein